MSLKTPREAKPSKRQLANKKVAELALARQAEQEAAEDRKKSAKHALSAAINSAVVVEAYGRKVWGEGDLQTIVDGLGERCKRVRGGDMRLAESLLVSQSKALDAMFSTLACRAMAQKDLETFDVHLRLALRAQNQCRATLETLAAIKNPPVVFAKQANIAHGHQQVNNGMAVAHAGETEKPQNELLEHHHGERLDTGAATAASGGDPTVATVVEIHRAEKRRGQGRIKP